MSIHPGNKLYVDDHKRKGEERSKYTEAAYAEYGRFHTGSLSLHPTDEKIQYPDATPWYLM